MSGPALSLEFEFQALVCFFLLFFTWNKTYPLQLQKDMQVSNEMKNLEFVF